ncbi:MAG: ParB/RepB/Spo0J family partition protein [Patescibacteria group bacterium]|jgi:ParB family chromosome partitioning protein
MALGRGLASLIPSKSAKQPADHSAVQITKPDSDVVGLEVKQIPVAHIIANPYQPRKQFSHHELEDLIGSIKQHGILQPLLVVNSEQETGKYQLIAGERRWRAARIAGLTTVPVIVRAAKELEQLELALIENIQRAELSPIEKAKGYKQLMDEFSLNQEEGARKLGISRSTFANTARLLELPEEIQQALIDKTITEGHAKILLGLPSAVEQSKHFKHIVAERWSVRTLELAVHGKTKHQHVVRHVNVGLPPHVHAWQNVLALDLATKVKIKSKATGGVIEIHYYSAEELGQLVKKITKFSAAAN